MREFGQFVSTVVFLTGIAMAGYAMFAFDYRVGLLASGAALMLTAAVAYEFYDRWE